MHPFDSMGNSEACSAKSAEGGLFQQRAAAKRLVLVRVVNSNLSFGCMHGIIEGSATPVTLALVDHRRQR